MRFTFLGTVSLIASQAAAVTVTQSTQTINYSTFDETRLGTDLDRFFLSIGAVRNLMIKVIADVQAVNSSFDVTQMNELKESLTCVETLARLFPEDL